MQVTERGGKGQVVDQVLDIVLQQGIEQGRHGGAKLLLVSASGGIFIGRRDGGRLITQSRQIRQRRSRCEQEARDEGSYDGATHESLVFKVRKWR